MYYTFYLFIFSIDTYIPNQSTIFGQIQIAVNCTPLSTRTVLHLKRDFIDFDFMKWYCIHSGNLTDFYEKKKKSSINNSQTKSNRGNRTTRVTTSIRWNYKERWHKSVSYIRRRCRKGLSFAWGGGEIFDLRHEFIKRTMCAYMREHVASQSITRIFIHDICHRADSAKLRAGLVLLYIIILYVDIMTIIALAQNIIITILHIMASIMLDVCVCPLSSFILYEICRMIVTVMYTL